MISAEDEFQSRASHAGLLNVEADKGRSTNPIANVATSLMNAKKSSAGAASAPTFAQFRLASEFFDMSFKFTYMLDSMSEIFRVTAALEGLLFFIAIIFFFVGEDRSTWYGVLALLHVARSFIGFAMGRVVPSSYDFVEKLEFTDK